MKMKKNNFIKEKGKEIMINNNISRVGEQIGRVSDGFGIKN